MEHESNEAAFPTLTPDEIAKIEALGEHIDFPDGAVIFEAGDADIDLFIVDDGELDVLNPTDNNRTVAVHRKGEFAGDIDLLTRRPVVVTAVARGRTRLLKIPGAKVREVLLRLPQISEKLLVAFQERRRLLASHGHVGLRLYGPGDCKDTNLIREFLDKNFVPYTWFDPTSPACTTAEHELSDGSRAISHFDAALSAESNGRDNGRQVNEVKHGPVVDCGGGKVLRGPTLQEVARCAGVWQECPTDTVDLVIIGAGPAGMSAAVYAASEGISTLVLDQLGPGGQAAASSKIENFIGFPAGLSGTDLATRAVIQMLKFGARMVAPVHVERLERSPDPDGVHTLHLDCGSVVKAKNVLLATGLSWRSLAALGTERFEHIGIYYACTATESISHMGEDVAVVGGGNSAGQAAMFLAEQCAHTVHLLIRGNDLAASMSTYLVDRIRATPNIIIHDNVEISKIIENGRLTGVELTSSKGEKSNLEITGLFVFIGAEPQVKWLPAEIARDPKGYLLTGADAAAAGCWPLKDREPCPLETTIPRIFAAGDVRSSSTKRVGFAVGDGALAVACVHTLR